MIEANEQTILYLEQLDNNFSLINRTLKDIQAKINNIYRINSKVVNDYKPLINFFSLKVELNEKPKFSENILNSSIIMKSSSPKDPFADTSIAEKSSSLVDNIKVYSDCCFDDSMSSDIVDFDIRKIPELFKNEENLYNVYNYINEHKKVTFENLVEHFYIIEFDKLTIYLNLLKNKNFIKKKGNFFICGVDI